LQQINKTFHM